MPKPGKLPMRLRTKLKVWGGKSPVNFNQMRNKYYDYFTVKENDLFSCKFSNFSLQIYFIKRMKPSKNILFDVLSCFQYRLPIEVGLEIYKSIIHYNDSISMGKVHERK